MNLRCYQHEAVAAATSAMSEHGSALLVMATGCIDGDAVVGINRAGKGVTWSLRQAYENESDPRRSPAIQTKIRSFLGDRVGLHGVQKILFSGVKPTWEMILRDGRSLRATPDHEILTPHGFVRLDYLSPGKAVVCEASPGRWKRSPKAKANYRVVQGMVHHPFAGGARSLRRRGNHVEGRMYRVPLHRLVVEANLNGVGVDELVRICREDPDRAAAMEFLDPAILAVHHKDRDSLNNSLDNLQVLTHEEHNAVHGREDKWKNLGKGLPEEVEIVAIKSDDVEREVFDVVCDDPHRNFVANGVVVHNCGKTVVLSEIVRQYVPRGRVMVLAHREELIRQLAGTIEKVAGTKPEIEMANHYADMNKFRRSDVVVSTVQTQRTRMSRFKPDQFSLVVVDEAHRGVSDGYLKVVNHYKQNDRLHVLGVTATPHRTDKSSLSKVFACCPFTYGIRDAVRDGWLVPVKQKFAVIHGLDFEKIPTVAGDFNPAELENAMMWEKPLQEVVSTTIESARNRKTIVFCVSVRHAERLAEVFNRHREGCAFLITGETPTERRKELLADFRAGKFQYLLNVMVFTEGFDEPGIEVVVMARPTKSILVYLQQLGRGTRPLPGVVDGLEHPHERSLAIASSAKPHMTVLDFVGNAGRHKIMSAMDALAGTDDQKVIDRAKKQAAETGDEVDAADAVDQEADRTQKELDEARAAEIARRAQLRGHAQYELVDAGGIEMELPANKRDRWKLDGPATPSQIQRLTKTYNVRNADKMSYGQAQAYLIRMAKGRAKAPASSGQEWYVRKIGKWRDGMTAGEASRLIAMSKKKNG